MRLSSSVLTLKGPFQRQWRHSDVFITNSKTHLHILEFWNFKNFLVLVSSSIVATRLLIFVYIRKLN